MGSYSPGYFGRNIEFTPIIKTTIMKIFFYAIALSFLQLNSCSSTDEVIKEETQQSVPASSEKDVPYGENPQQTYDIYLPADRSVKKTKTLIIVHGGSWVSGDKADLDGFVSFSQEAFPDYAVVNMNYRLSNGTTVPAFPNQINDVDAVIKKLTGLKKELNINGEFAFMGFSAGAHLATLYDYSYDTNNQVKTVINIVGPVDFTDPYYTNNTNFQKFLDGLVDKDAYPTDANTAALLSPVEQVSEQSSPTINFYGNQDQLVAIKSINTFRSRIERK